MPERNHAAALDELRSLAVAEVSQAFRCRSAWRWGADKEYNREGRLRDHAEVRACVARVRALDALRDHAADRAYMAELWMLIACGKTREEAAREARAKMAERAEVPR